MHERGFIPGQFDPFLLTKTHSMSHSIGIPHQSQLVRKSTCTQVYSYTGQLAPMSHLSEVASKSSRTQVINLHPNQLVHKSTVTQVDSHPSQLAPKSHPSQLAPKSHTSQLSPKLIRTQVNSHPSHIQVNSHPSRTQVNLHPNKFTTKSTRAQVPVN